MSDTTSPDSVAKLVRIALTDSKMDFSSADEELLRPLFEAGMRSHGPIIEHVTMPVSQFVPELRAIVSELTAVPVDLARWGASLRADLQHNDHCTADPVFTVEKRRRIYGMDANYSETFTWIQDCDECTPEECATLDTAYDETGEEPDGCMRVGYVDLWEHVASYITPEPARDFVAAKGKDYRVMVDSGCRNSQWKQLRAFLLALPDPCASGTKYD